MDRSVPRVGAWAGLIAVVMILGYHLSLMALAGPRVSGTSDVATIEAYYENGAIAVLGVSQFAAVIAFLVFAAGLRETIARSATTRLAATIGLAAAVAEVPVVVTEIALQAGLVAAVEAGEPIAGAFRFWDVLYNSGLYPIEATVVLAFGHAIRAVQGFPRAMPVLSLVAGTLLAINTVAIWFGIPDVATLPSAAAFTTWIVGATVGLRRVGREPRGRLVIEPVR